MFISARKSFVLFEDCELENLCARGDFFGAAYLYREWIAIAAPAVTCMLIAAAITVMEGTQPIR